MRLIDSLTKYINCTITEHDELKIPIHSKVYYRKSTPILSIEKYINILLKLVKLDNSSGVILSIIVIFNRIKKTVTISKKTVHRVFLISLILASKIYEDEHCQNIFWARLHSQKLDTINNLEIHTLKLLDFNFFISELQMHHVAKNICVK